MRLTQPFLQWQLAIVLIVGFPVLALAQNLDNVTRAQALEAADFPRDVVLVGELPDGIDEATWRDAIDRTVATWSSVECSYAELRYAGRVDTVDDADDEATTVAWVDGAAEDCFAVDNDVGWTVLSQCGPWRPTSVLLNRNGYEWTAEPMPYAEHATVDVTSVLTHELGHSLGIVHADVSDPLSSMAPNYLRDGGLATLAAEDKLALCELYPTDAAECTSDDDCAGDCVERDGFEVCDELRIGAGGYCDLAELNCADGAACLVTSSQTYSGYCSPACAEDGDCGSDMICVEEQCQFEVIPLAGDGCATASGAPSTRVWWLLALLFSAVSRRRRSSASSRTTSSSRCDCDHRTCRPRAMRPRTT